MKQAAYTDTETAQQQENDGRGVRWGGGGVVVVRKQQQQQTCISAKTARLDRPEAILWNGHHSARHPSRCITGRAEMRLL